MSTRLLLGSALFGLSLVGACATDMAGGGDDGGWGGGGGGGGGGGDSPERLDLSGRYQLDTELDLITNFPGGLGDAVEMVVDATDDGDDPAQFLLELVIENVSSGTMQSLLEAAASLAAGMLNDYLLDWAPDFVDSFIELGDRLGEAGRSFHLESTLDIAGSPGAHTATHTATGFRMTLGGVEETFTLAAAGVEPVPAAGVPVTVDGGGAVTLGAHPVTLPHAALLRVALDEAILPGIMPGVDNLGDFLTRVVDCDAVGDIVASAVGFGGSSLYRGACELGLDAAASLIYDQLGGQLDGGVALELTGAARAEDADGDLVVDQLSRGNWTGTVGGDALEEATFVARRR